MRACIVTSFSGWSVFTCQPVSSRESAPQCCLDVSPVHAQLLVGPPGPHAVHRGSVSVSCVALDPATWWFGTSIACVGALFPARARVLLAWLYLVAIAAVLWFPDVVRFFLGVRLACGGASRARCGKACGILGVAARRATARRVS